MVVGSRFRKRRGDVLMEYVLVTMLIILPIIGSATAFFSPAGRTVTVEGTIEGEDFGILGNAFVDMYRKIMCGVGLPIP